MYIQAIILSVIVLVVSIFVVYVNNITDRLDKKNIKIERLEVENKMLIEFKKGLCDEKKREEDIKNSSDDANGTVYNWVFLKNR